MTLEHQGLGERVLHVSDVSFIRGHRTILDTINIEVLRGQRWALIGPNGAGKSTLINLLAAVTHPSRGEVSVLGYRLGRVDMRELRQHIGYVDPRHAIDRDLSAHDVALTGITGTIDLVPRWQPSKAENDRATELLALVGLAQPHALRWPTMSHGERGRTLIARALINDPALLLLDEATTGLDVAAREQLLVTMSRLAASHPHMATVTVTHHFEELPVTTTHAALMRHGRIVAQGDVDKVVTSDSVTDCFDHPIEITKTDGRWSARAR